MATRTSLPSPLTSRELAERITEECGVDVQIVKKVLRALGDVTAQEVSAGYPVTVPGVAKVTFKYAPAKPRREVTNPRTGETRMAPPKPASLRAKALPAPTLKLFVPSLRSYAGKDLAATFERRMKANARKAKARDRQRA